MYNINVQNCPFVLLQLQLLLHIDPFQQPNSDAVWHFIWFIYSELTKIHVLCLKNAQILTKKKIITLWTKFGPGSKPTRIP